jgi:hypothetical protein
MIFDRDIIQYCEQNKDNCIALLKTPRAGENVENGMGVDFDLPPYSIICHDRDKIKLDDAVKNYIPATLLVQKFEIENCKSLQGMIDELKERDAYEVIWRDETYKEPDKLKSELKIGDGDIECRLSISGSIKIYYSDLSKYFSDRVNPSNWQSDIFHEAIEDYNDKTDIIGCRFIGDSAHLENVLYFKDYMEFVFSISAKESFSFEKNISQKFLPVNSTVDKRSLFCNLVKELEGKIKIPDIEVKEIIVIEKPI